MAQDDIYLLTVYYEGPSQSASVGIYYQEDALSTNPIGPTRSLAQTFNNLNVAEIRDVLSSQWAITAIHVRRVNGDPVVAFLFSTGPAAGLRGSQALPANNCLLLALLQSKHPRTSNGRLYFPGLAESDTEVGRLDSTFQSTEVQALVTALVASLAEVGGTGSWTPGVVSTKVLNANPPAKDWDGAFATLIGIEGRSVIARQRRRQTRVRGQS